MSFDPLHISLFSVSYPGMLADLNRGSCYFDLPPCLYAPTLNVRGRSMGYRDKDSFPSPQDVLKLDVTQLKSAGLSGRKAEYGQFASIHRHCLTSAPITNGYYSVRRSS